MEEVGVSYSKSERGGGGGGGSGDTEKRGMDILEDSQASGYILEFIFITENFG